MYVSALIQSNGYYWVCRFRTNDTLYRNFRNSHTSTWYQDSNKVFFLAVFLRSSDSDVDMNENRCNIRYSLRFHSRSFIIIFMGLLLVVEGVFWCFSCFERAIIHWIGLPLDMKEAHNRAKVCLQLHAHKNTYYLIIYLLIYLYKRVETRDDKCTLDCYWFSLFSLFFERIRSSIASIKIAREKYNWEILEIVATIILYDWVQTFSFILFFII